MEHELYLSPVRPERNLKTGQFMKGHKPPLKGKTWKEVYSPEVYARQMERIRNTFRRNPKGYCPAAGINRKKVVAVKDGKFFVFDSAREASAKTGALSCKICECCKGRRKHSGGFRWFYESDERWLELVTKV